METSLSSGKSGQDCDDIFIALEGVSQVVCGGWVMAVVWIQCFDFGLRVERQDETLPEDEANATSSSWLYGKEA
jgi:hypothetical protein